MNIAILILLALAATIGAWLFLAFWSPKQDNDSAETVTNEPVKKTLQPTSKRIVFLALMFAGLCAMAITLNVIYANNTLVHNAKMISLLAILFVAANTDARKRLIPNKLVLIGLVLRVVFWVMELITVPDEFLKIVKNDLYACVLVVVFFIIGVLLVKGGIGMGDIKLMLVMCLFQGFYGVVSSLFCSLFIAFIYAIIVLLLRKKTKKDSVAFAPAILLGTALSIFLTGM